MSKHEVIGCGFTYTVVIDGKMVGGPYGSFWAAEHACDDFTRQSKMKERPCITCRDLFESEGAHNRMCDPCRKGIKGESFHEGVV